MTSQQTWDTIFKDDNYVQKYTIGEKITGQYAQALVDQSRLVADSRANAGQWVVLDNACGTGIISSTLNASLDNEVKRGWKLTCGDTSEGMLEHTRRRMKQEGWPNAEVKTVDARDNGLPSAHYTHAFTAFGFMAIPNSLTALDETCRILRPGGSICFSTWIEPGWVSAAKQAVETIPGNLPSPTTEQFLAAMDNGDWNSVPWIESQLQQRGLEDIKVTISATTVSLSVPELVEMIMIAFPMIARYFWTEKQRQESEDKVRPAVTSYLEGTYGTEVTMRSTAILSTARKPSR